MYNKKATIKPALKTTNTEASITQKCAIHCGIMLIDQNQLILSIYLEKSFL